MLRPLRSALPRASSLSAPPTSLIHHCRLRRYNHTNSQPPSPTVRKKSPSPRPIPTYLHTHIHPNKKKPCISTLTTTNLPLSPFCLPQQAAFYRTFTRPVAKCALIAVLVYQVVYFGWTKLEHEEIKAERQGE